MTRRCLAAIIGVICLAASVGWADTGTYRILAYRVRLAPHSDGTVQIDYYQTWRVESGHIPWITVGLPNANFKVQSSGLNARSVRDECEDGWSGVRINLDRDYRPGQTFEVQFTVKQRSLFYSDAKNYWIAFSPGWYDRAPIDSLEIRIHSPAKLESVTAQPTPTAREGEELVWRRTGLAPGARAEVSITFPRNVLTQPIPNAVDVEPLSPQEDKLWSAVSTIVFIVVIVLLLLLLRALGHRAGGRYTGGSISHGGGSGGGGRVRTGGGGGFGGGGFSCACACVSCACACACAGGGGAGCSRKATHTCPLCGDRRPEKT
jgi:hypothetical protein